MNLYELLASVPGFLLIAVACIVIGTVLAVVCRNQDWFLPDDDGYETTPLYRMPKGGRR